MIKYSVFVLCMFLVACNFTGQANKSVSEPIECVYVINNLVDGRCDNMYPFTKNGNTLYTPYCTNYELDTYNPEITRLVFVIHGSALNNLYGLDTMTMAANDLGEYGNTLIVAPRFLEDDVFDAEGYPDNTLLWSTGWREGHLSWDTTAYPRPFRISSYEVADTILSEIITSGNFPNIDKVTVVGHSAGGQFTNRYAAGNFMEDNVMIPNNIKVRYITSNAANRMYFDNTRRVPGTLDQFEPLSGNDLSACPGYNDYRYGLEGLNSFMRSVGVDNLRQNYLNRNVIEFDGELDIEPDPDFICEWDWQGSQHLERAIIYWNHLQDYFGPGILENHELVINPGVGHSSRGMFYSELGKELIFWNDEVQEPIPEPRPKKIYDPTVG